MVNRVKSYGGEDGDICALHILDIDDKLHLLIPMFAVTGTAKICGRIGHKLAEVLFRAQDDL